MMYISIEERAIELAHYIIDSKDTVRGAAKKFGISKSNFVDILRSLNSETNRLIVAELNMGLDNITLRDDITSVDVLKLML